MRIISKIKAKILKSEFWAEVLAFILAGLFFATIIYLIFF